MGIAGKLWRVIRNMYQTVESCVQLGPYLTEWFRIELGVRQGDPLSSFLYIIFIDGLVSVVKESGIGVMIGDILVSILLFADDVMLLASSNEDMQKLLDLVYVYSRKWRFLFNVTKSKALLFTNKRVIPLDTSLYLGLERLDEVRNFRYLGVEFKANLSWRLMKEKMVKKAKARLALLRKAVADGLAPDTSLKLWYTLVRPILEYSVEVWGFTKWPEAECVQTEMGRLILGVGSKTANDAVRGELGLWTMEGRRQLAILRWWGKIISMDKRRLCYKIYKYRRDHLKNRPNWCNYVRNLLIGLNMGHIWLTEDIESYPAWCALLKQQIRKKESDEWRRRLIQHSKLRVYRTLKTDLVFESYLTDISEQKYRKEFSKIRSGTNELRVDIGRRSKEAEKDRLCCLCGSGEVETEQHFLLDCFVYDEHRLEMYRSIRNLTGDRFGLSMRMDDKQWLLKVLLGQEIEDKSGRKVIQTVVCKFLRKALARRKHFLS